MNALRQPDAVLDRRPEGPLHMTLVDTDRCIDQLLIEGEIDAYLGARCSLARAPNESFRQLLREVNEHGDGEEDGGQHRDEPRGP